MWFLFALGSSVILALVNVIDSTIIHKYEKSSITVMWFVGMFRLPILLCFLVFTSVQTEHWLILSIAGCMLYLCSLLYLYVLQHIDASVTQSAWAIESILLSILGFIFFSESWSFSQSIGAIFILLSVFILSYWHRHISIKHTLGLLLLLAAIGAPAEFGLKYVVDRDVPYHIALFWYLLAASILSLFLPLSHKISRTNIHNLLKRAPSKFYIFFLIEIILSFIGFATSIQAFVLGPLSLVTIVNNVQIFFVILIAWILTKTKTTHVPKELLSQQSIVVKLTCFTLLSVGLVLLA